MNEIARSASQNEESRPERAAVAKDPKRFKERGPTLNLVDHDKSAELFQGQLRGLKPGQIGLVLEVKRVSRLRGAHPQDKLPGQSGLAALARAQDGDYGMNFQQAPDFPKIVFAFHALLLGQHDSIP